MTESESPFYKIIHYGLELFGRYYSTYRGFVISNEDPDNMNRLLIVVPEINPNDKKGQWAYPKHSWGGKDYGTSMIPKVGDMIMVEFQHGDTEVPLWSHAGWGLDEKPEELKPITNYGFKTPNKNLIVIEDGSTTDDGKILVKFKTGQEYYLISKELFELEAKQIKLGKNGDESAVLGDTLKDQLENILDLLKQQSDLLATHVHPSTGAPPAQAGLFTALGTQLSTASQQLRLFLSGKVKLDK